MTNPGTNPIDKVFAGLKAQKRKAFIPFITAGDPSLRVTAALITVLARRGASLIEIGFPYSDPIADGSVIQASYTRALGAKVRIDDIFRTVKEISKTKDAPLPPLVAMVSYSLVHHRGSNRF